MPISYPVDVTNSRWAVHDSNLDQIIARNQLWPEGSGLEIPGLDPAITYCLQVEGSQPQYDSRTHYLVRNETLDLAGNELVTSWTSEQRPIEEREVAVDNREMQEAERHIHRQDLMAQVAELTIVVGILIDIQEGLSLPPKKQKIFDKAKSRGLKLFRNRNNAARIKASEVAGDNPDQDSGWETEEG